MTKKENAGLMESLDLRTVRGRERERERQREREREREKTQKTIFQNSNSILCYYMYVCSMHTFYTIPYKD